MRFIIRAAAFTAVFLTATTYAFAERGAASSRMLRATPIRRSMLARPDSMIWERLAKDRPSSSTKRVPMRKWKQIGPGALMDSVVVRLQQSGFFELSSEQIDHACGSPGTTANRWSIRVLDNGAWRELVIPDHCAPTDPTLAAQVVGLREIGVALWSHRLE